MSSVVDLNNAQRMDLVISRSDVNHLQTFPGFVHRSFSLRQSYLTSKVGPFEVLKPFGFDSLDSMEILLSEHCEMGDNQTISDPTE